MEIFLKGNALKYPRTPSQHSISGGAVDQQKRIAVCASIAPIVMTAAPGAGISFPGAGLADKRRTGKVRPKIQKGESDFAQSAVDRRLFSSWKTRPKSSRASRLPTAGPSYQSASSPRGPPLPAGGQGFQFQIRPEGTWSCFSDIRRIVQNLPAEVVQRCGIAPAMLIRPIPVTDRLFFAKPCRVRPCTPFRRGSPKKREGKILLS